MGGAALPRTPVDAVASVLGLRTERAPNESPAVSTGEEELTGLKSEEILDAGDGVGTQHVSDQC